MWWSQAPISVFSSENENFAKNGESRRKEKFLSEEKNSKAENSESIEWTESINESSLLSWLRKMHNEERFKCGK